MTRKIVYDQILNAYFTYRNSRSVVHTSSICTVWFTANEQVLRENPGTDSEGDGVTAFVVCRVLASSNTHDRWHSPQSSKMC